MKYRILPILFGILFLTILGQAQPLSQTIRGDIVDDVTHVSLPGATIAIIGTDPLLGTASNEDGSFRIDNVPVGTYRVIVSFIGYKDQVLSSVIVNSGKETVLHVALTEDVKQMNEVVVVANPDKNKPLNDMAAVSTRTFSVEETRKYAAAVNDPARMAASYAGVVSTDDGSNMISIRGNAPFGLQWRMEGVEIPNPNHFASVGSSGGGISILSAQLLSNSDFLTGAFPAEYGNALSGVFDLRLRQGNNEKRENTFQAGLLGVDLATEGPFSSNRKGSYLVNYRYSTLSLLDHLGVPIGFGVTNFQDLSYNVTLPTKKAGTFSLFGFGGLSSQYHTAEKDSTAWESNDERYNFNYHTNTGAAGLKHLITLGDRIFVQSNLLLSGVDHGYGQERLNQEYVPEPDFDELYRETKTTISTKVNYKLSAKSYIRSGVEFHMISYNLYQRGIDQPADTMRTWLDSKGSGTVFQSFSQWNYRAGEKVTLNTGVHYVSFLFNGTYSLEPRASVTWQPSDIESLSFGYGLHGQMLPIAIYFTRSDNGNTPNENLGFMKANHFVLSYDRSLNKYLHAKVETYYQHLFSIPVSDDISNPMSLINNQDGYVTDALVSEGKGRNYGVEITVEQFMHRNTYFLLSTSLYDSKYQALDHVWRNTRYNGNYSMALTAGKDMGFERKGKQKTVGINLRTLYLGGFRDTPIDLALSKENGQTEWVEQAYFTKRLPPYFRSDIRISYKVNRPKATTTLALDIQNVTNHQNLFGQYFDALTGEVKKAYQAPLIPIISYKVEF